MKTLTLSVAALAALFATGATAQTVVTSDYRPITDETFVVQPWGVTVDDLDDMDLYGPNGDEVGEVEEVLTDPAGKVVGLTVEAGGFLGIGEKDVIMTLDQLEYASGRLTTALTEDQIADLPEWKD